MAITTYDPNQPGIRNMQDMLQFFMQQRQQDLGQRRQGALALSRATGSQYPGIKTLGDLFGLPQGGGAPEMAQRPQTMEQLFASDTPFMQPGSQPQRPDAGLYERGLGRMGQANQSLYQVKRNRYISQKDQALSKKEKAIENVLKNLGPMTADNVQQHAAYQKELARIEMQRGNLGIEFDGLMQGGGGDFDIE